MRPIPTDLRPGDGKTPTFASATQIIGDCSETVLGCIVATYNDAFDVAPLVRLACAAPDLLAACKALYRTHSRNCGGGPAECSLCAQAEKALAKAAPANPEAAHA